MQVLNIYGKIKRTIISNKLGLCVSNIPVESKKIIIDAINKELKIIGKDNNVKLNEIFDKYIEKDIINKCKTKQEKLKKLVNNIICLRSINFKNSFLFIKNKIPDPIDQIEYGDKFLKFLEFIIKDKTMWQNYHNPLVMYNTHFFYDDTVSHIINYLYAFRENDLKKDTINYIDDLKNVGLKIDDYLGNIHDFKKFDFIVSTLSSINERDYGTIHFVNIVSLLEMLLVYPKDSGDLKELDVKLPTFIVGEQYTDEEKKKIAKLIRKLRNKISHGDFIAYEKLCEEFALIGMKNFWFDYSEYDRISWIVSDLCFLVDKCLANVIWLMLNDNRKLLKIQNDKVCLR